MASEAYIFESIERPGPLSANQLLLVGLCSIAGMLEFLDGYIIAFVLAFITGPWGLNYGAAAVVLLSSGIGALLGSLVWGHLSDRLGRRVILAATICTCAAGSLALAFTPEGNWIYLAVLRLVVGFGTGGFFVAVMLVQEFLPERRRGSACGFLSAAAASGLVLGALSGSFLGPIIGWRGMFVIGALPLLFGIAVYFIIPESPHWAMAKGLPDLARRGLAWARPGAEIVLPIARPPSAVGKWREVLLYPGSLAASCLINLGVVTGYYGMVMWSPTLIAKVQSIGGAEAAQLMIWVSVAGLASRIVASGLSDRFGRRRSGVAAAMLTGVALMAAALVGHGDFLDRKLFWAMLTGAFVFADSTLAILSVYTPEIWPAYVRGRGAGLAYAAGGVGKIIGPLGFALVLGTSNVIRPMATVNAIINAFAFLAVAFVLAGLACLLIRPDARPALGAEGALSPELAG